MIRFQTEIDFQRVLDLDDEYLVPLARVHHLLNERGIAFSPSRGEFLLADTERGPSAWDRPVVLVDRTDGAFLHWRFAPHASLVHELLQSPSLAGVIKISRYPTVEIYNSPIGKCGEHVRRIGTVAPHAPSLTAVPSALALTDEQHNKLSAGAGYWAFSHCDPLATGDACLSGRRPIDVFCSITIQYHCPLISWHRRQALDRLAELSGPRVLLGRGRVFTADTFRGLMRQSRICVSPWGWGETCYRDYEALLAGCVLIKPRTDFIDSELPLDDRHYVACKPDFSDLNQRILEVLDDWPHYAERRQPLRDEVLHARCLDVQADRWALNFARAVGQA